MPSPFPQSTVDGESGERVEWIKRANLRLIHRIGTGPDGRPSVADEMCAEQARVMRLARTINYKMGRYARLVQVDLSLARHSVAELVSDLPDPPSVTASSRRRPRARSGGPQDSYRRIPPPEYFAKLAGVSVPRSGYVLCLHLGTPRRPRRAVFGRSRQEAGGASDAVPAVRSTTWPQLMLGGPTGQALGGDAFTAARELVVDRFGRL